MCNFQVAASVPLGRRDVWPYQPLYTPAPPLSCQVHGVYAHGGAQLALGGYGPPGGFPAPRGFPSPPSHHHHYIHHPQVKMLTTLKYMKHVCVYVYKII